MSLRTLILMDNKRDYEAFDALPPMVRAAVRGLPFNCPARVVQAMVECHGEKHTLRRLMDFRLRGVEE